MKRNIFIIILLAIVVGFQLKQSEFAVAKTVISPIAKQSQEKVLASHVLPLNDRYAVPSVSDVFRDNILLTLFYASGKVSTANQINWNEIRKPFNYEFTLKPGEVFAFHDDVSPQYAGKTIITTHAHFNAQEGFVSDGYLYGDGVCHLASVINWVARDAGLKVEAPVNHDFAHIPDVPREYGTSIYSAPGQSGINQMQNLYIENTSDKAVKFVFEYKDSKLTVKVVRS
jgi:hypothetical protein